MELFSKEDYGVMGLTMPEGELIDNIGQTVRKSMAPKLDRDLLNKSLASEYPGDDEARALIAVHFAEQMKLDPELTSFEDVAKHYDGNDDVRHVYDILNQKAKYSVEDDSVDEYNKKDRTEKFLEAHEAIFGTSPDAEFKGDADKLIAMHEKSLLAKSPKRWYMQVQAETSPKMQQVAEQMLLAGEFDPIKYEALGHTKQGQKDRALLLDYLMLVNPERATDIISRAGIRVGTGLRDIGESLGATLENVAEDLVASKFDSSYVYTVANELPEWKEAFDEEGNFTSPEAKEALIVAIARAKEADNLSSEMRRAGVISSIDPAASAPNWNDIFGSGAKEKDKSYESILREVRDNVDNLQDMYAEGSDKYEEERYLYKLRKASRERFEAGEGIEKYANMAVDVAVPAIMDLGAAAVLSAAGGPMAAMTYSASRFYGGFVDELQYEYNFKEKDAKTWAAVATVPYALIEFLQVKGVEKGLKATGWKSIASKAYREGFEESMLKTLRKGAGEWAVDSAGEITQEMTQSAIEMGTKSFMASLYEGSTVDERKLLDEFKEEALAIAIGMPFVTGGARGAGAAFQLSSDIVEHGSFRAATDSWGTEVAIKKLQDEGAEYTRDMEIEKGKLSDTDMMNYSKADGIDERLAVLESANVIAPEELDAFMQGDEQRADKAIKDRYVARKVTEYAIETIKSERDDGVTEAAVKKFDDVLAVHDGEAVEPSTQKDVPDQTAPTEEVAELYSALTKMGVSTDVVNALSATSDPKHAGQYDGLRKEIQILASQSNDATVWRHEAFHALVDLGVVSKKDWGILEKALNTEKFAKLNLRYSDMEGDAKLEEVAADAWGEWSPEERTAVQKVWDFVRDLLKIKQTEGDVFRRVADSIASGKHIKSAPTARADSKYATREALPETIDVDGVQRSTTNSEGNPIHSTEEGVRNFWAWFGDSKVVDSNDKPLVVYHMSKESGVDRFIDNRKTWLSPFGFHLGTLEQAQFRATQFDFKDIGAELLELYSSMQSPLRVSHQASFRPDWLAEEMMDADMLTEEEYDSLYDEHGDDDVELGTQLVEILRSNGHDGLVYSNEREGAGDSYVPFNSNQVKSTDNTGAFSSTDDRFRFATRESLPETIDVDRMFDYAVESLAKRIDSGKPTGVAEASVMLEGMPAFDIDAILERSKQIAARDTEALGQPSEGTDITIEHASDISAMERARERAIEAAAEKFVVNEMQGKVPTQRAKRAAKKRTQKFGNHPLDAAFTDARTKTEAKEAYNDLSTSEKREGLYQLTKAEAKRAGVYSKVAIDSAYRRTVARILQNNTRHFKKAEAIHRRIGDMHNVKHTQRTVDKITDEVYARINAINEKTSKEEAREDFEKRLKGKKSMKLGTTMLETDITKDMRDELAIINDVYTMQKSRKKSKSGEQQFMTMGDYVKIIDDVLSDDDPDVDKIAEAYKTVVSRVGSLSRLSSVTKAERLRIAARLIDVYGGIAGGTAQEIRVAIDNLDHSLMEDKAALIESSRKQAEESKVGREALMRGAKSDSGKRKKTKGQMHGWFWNIHQRFQVLGRFSSTGEKDMAIVDDLIDLQGAVDRKETILREKSNQIIDLIADAWGIDKERFKSWRIEDLVYRLNEKLQKYAKYDLVNGDAMSISQMLQLIGLWDSGDYITNIMNTGTDRKYKRADILAMKADLAGVDQRAPRETIEAAFINSKYGKLLDNVRLFYRELGDDVDVAAMEVLGHTLSVPGVLYLPAVTDVKKLWGNAEMIASPLVSNGLKKRIPNSRALDIEAGLLGVLDSKLRENAHWIGHVKSQAMARNIFSNEEAERMLSRVHGIDWTMTKEHLSDVFTDRRAGGSQTRGMRSAIKFTTLSSLAYNTKIPFTQLTSVMAYALEGGLWDSAAMIKGAAVDPRGYLEALQALYTSDQFKNRWAGGNNEFVEAALRKALGDNSSFIPEGGWRTATDNVHRAIGKFVKAGMLGNKAGDALPILLMGPAVYMSELKKTNSPEKAMSNTWKRIRSTQQSYATKDRNWLSRRGGAFAQFANQFISTPGQYAAFEQLWLSKVIADPNKNKSKLLGAVVISHLFLSGAYSAISNVYASLIDPEEDDWFTWNEEDTRATAASVVVGPNNAWFLAGAAFEAFARSSSTGKRGRGNSILPAAKIVDLFDKAGVRAYDLSEDFEWSEAGEAFIEIMTELSAGGKQVKKIMEKAD